MPEATKRRIIKGYAFINYINVGVQFMQIPPAKFTGHTFSGRIVL
jgi:hypothetical protein